MADQKSDFSWEEFKERAAKDISEAWDYLNPFRKVEIDELETKDFVSKWMATVKVLEGTDPTDSDKNEPGILDWLCLGIPRFLLTGLWKLAPEDTEDNPMNPLHWIWMGPLLVMTFLWVYAQKLVAYLLAAICTPFVGLVHWLYPVDQDFVDEAAAAGKDYDEGTVGRNRRRAFFNPSTWMFGFVVTLAVGFLIQGLVSNGLVGAEILAQAAGPLLMIQTVFTGLAALMLIGAVLGLVHHVYEVLTTDADPEAPNYPKSAVVEYFKDFYQWIVDHPVIAVPVMIFGVGSVLAVLVLTIGYFTGFGFPGVFDFMLPVFQFIGSGFSAGLQGLSGLPGLEFLGGIAAGPGLELASQIFTIFALVAGTMFAVDTVRRVTQTATEGPVKPDEDSGKQPLSNQEQPKEQGCFDWLFGNDKAKEKQKPNHAELQQQREQALMAEERIMATKASIANTNGTGFTEIMIANTNRDFVAGSNGADTAGIEQGKRVYLDPASRKNGWVWGAMGPDATPGWIAESDLQPVVDLDALASGFPKK